MGTPVAVGEIVRTSSVLLVALTIGCAAGRPAPRAAVTSTPPERIEWLQAAVARGDLETAMRGAYVPRGTPGSDILCSLAIQIDAWYGVGDDRWELTHASEDLLTSEPMRRARSSRNMREELARIGIRDCILDVNR